MGPHPRLISVALQEIEKVMPASQVTEKIVTGNSKARHCRTFRSNMEPMQPPTQLPEEVLMINSDSEED